MVWNNWAFFYHKRVGGGPIGSGLWGAVGNLWNAKRDGWTIDDVDFGETGLHIACAHQQENVALLLLHLGADWRIKNANGCTALDVAEQKQLHRVTLNMD